MTASRPATHLVERAVQAMGPLEGLGSLPRQERPAPPADHQPARPAARPAAEPKPPAAQRSVVSLATLERAGLRALPGQPRSRISEEVAVVQHQIVRTLQESGGPGRSGRAAFSGKIILVTSARSGEGKTHCALNIAAGLARSGTMPVVLIDSDGKPGSLSALLGLERAPGLLQVMASGSQPSLAGLLCETAVPRLTVLPYGIREAEGAALPSGAALGNAVQQLAAALSGHALLLDAQPCLASSDPTTLASVADQVLMVVQAERTSRAEVEAALDMVDACTSLQLVLNKVRISGQNTFGAYA